jgi:hypothetical protein
MLPGIALELKGGGGCDVLYSVIEMKGTTKFIFFVLPSDKISSCLSFLGFYFLLCDWCSLLILAAISDVDRIWEGDDPSDVLFQQVEHP